MKISILIPTFRRPKLLLRAVHSAFALAAEPDNIEVIVRVSHNDETGLDLIGKIPQHNTRVILGPQLNGYMDLHRLTTECAALSTGAWLMAFNDDAYFDSRDWDLILPNPEGKRLVFPKIDWPIARNDKEYLAFAAGPRYDFPIITRKLYETIGCFSPTTVYDWFWHGAFHRFPFLGGEVLPGLVIQHEYLRRKCADTILDVEKEEKVIEYRTPEMQQQIEQAYSKIP